MHRDGFVVVSGPLLTSMVLDMRQLILEDIYFIILIYIYNFLYLIDTEMTKIIGSIHPIKIMYFI